MNQTYEQYRIQRTWFAYDKFKKEKKMSLLDKLKALIQEEETGPSLKVYPHEKPKIISPTQFVIELGFKKNFDFTDWIRDGSTEYIKDKVKIHITRGDIKAVYKTPIFTNNVINITINTSDDIIEPDKLLRILEIFKGID